MIYYAITDSSTLNFLSLKQDIEYFASKADMILYRDKKNKNYTANAKQFINESKKYNFHKILLHQNIELACKLKADGVHLSSNQFQEISLAKKKNLFVIISTHNLDEIEKAQRLGADMVTFSPIFNSPNKGKAVGLEELKYICRISNIPIIALGGILTIREIKLCLMAKAAGFASIRYFTRNKTQ